MLSLNTMKRSISEITKELAKEHAEYSRLTTKRTGINKIIIELKAELTEIMNEEEMQQIKNPNGTFYFSRRKKPTVMDHEEFAEFVYSHRSLDLLHMHLNKEAEYLTERLMETTGQGIPGVDIIEFKVLNVKGTK